MDRPHSLRLFSLLALAATALGASHQDPSTQGPGPQGAARAAMWPAPTAEDWAKPCLIQWQRTWDDALAVARDSGRPIMICVNMDGEVASEHYAGVRYRQPDIAKLYEPYVLVIASVYRHSPRDFDDAGERVECPRFGTVTCGEHIAIEPLLFDKYFENRRVAPRHIKIELDRSEAFDVYYAFDTASVFEAVRSGGADLPPWDTDRGDRPLEQKVASRDAADRRAVEKAYAEGDALLRRTILRTAAEHVSDVSHADLLRLAVFGEDAEAARIALGILIANPSEETVDLAAEALKLPLGEEERGALLASLDRLAETSTRARTLVAIHRGLAAVTGFDLELAPAPREEPALDSRLEYRAEAVRAVQDDGDAHAALAEAFYERGFELGEEAKRAELWSADARREALLARDLGSTAWQVDAILALTAEDRADREEILAHATKALTAMPAVTTSRLSFELLGELAAMRRRSIVAAVRRSQEFDPQWLAQATESFERLAVHPFGGEDELLDYHDFLAWLGADARAEAILQAALRRFPDSWDLHDRLRRRLLALGRIDGLNGLEATYRRMMQAEGASPNLPWFAGYATLLVAEHHRRGARFDDARAAYDRALELYDRAIAANESSRATADHYAALALAGKGRIAFERGEDELALSELCAAFARKPEAAGSLDGLELSAVATARSLRERLAAANRPELTAQLDAALAALPPVAFEPPWFERQGRAEPSPDARRFRR